MRTTRVFKLNNTSGHKKVYTYIRIHVLKVAYMYMQKKTHVSWKNFKKRKQNVLFYAYDSRFYTKQDKHP